MKPGGISGCLLWTRNEPSSSIEPPAHGFYPQSSRNTFGAVALLLLNN
jgi:hypothetical protein